MSNVASNTIATRKKPGGITGKGFVPGLSGNPEGGTRRRREAKALSEQIRDYLAKPDEKATEEAGRKVTRLQSLIMRLEQTDPRTLLAYAYGKPVEMIQQVALDNRVIIVKHGNELDAETGQQATPRNTSGVDVRFANEDDSGD